MKMKLLCTALIAGSLALAGGAHAQTEAPKAGASLSSIEGSVLINKGEEFVEGTSGGTLGPGDRVMAMDGSSALLRFEDGCDVRVDPGTVVTMGEGSPCAGWPLLVEQVAPGGLAVGAAGTTGAVGGAGFIAGTSPWVYVPAAVLAGGLIYKEYEDDPSSP
jgi:hypothetical protein